ncbi:MAG: FAD binding domain-containing protein [Candidatus Thorarchaeota archaeon]
MVYSVLSFKSLPKFTYLQPKNIKEALELLNEYQNNAVILAGGSDLLSDLRNRLKIPKVVIDLKKIKDFNTAYYDPNLGVVINATATFQNIENIPELKTNYKAFYDVCQHLCDSIVRERAGPVGNICTSSPAGDSAPALMIYDAKIEISSLNETREIKLQDFFIGVKRNILKPNEMVTKLIIPPVEKNEKSSYIKIMRNSEDLAIVGCALRLAKQESGKIVLRAGFSSVAPTPVYINLDSLINDKTKSPKERIQKIVSTCLEKVSPIDDVRGGAEYRKHLVKVLLIRGIRDLVGGIK